MAKVRLDGVLRELGPGPRWESHAANVAGLLEELEAAYPRLRRRIRDEAGEIRRSVRVCVNGADVRNGAGTGTAIAPTDQVDILHSIQGG